MRNTYSLSAKQLLCGLLLAAVGGAALTLAISTRWISSVVAQANAAKKNPVVHFEIGGRDSAKTQAFYGKLFDWEIKQAGPAANITAAPGGIDGHITALGHEPYNYVTVYVQVDDIATYLEKAKALGGKTLIPAVPIPTGKFAWLADPDGNMIGLLQPKK